jgi:hypothetical protein
LLRGDLSYGGGWEVNNTLYSMRLGSKNYDIKGLVSTSQDPDGDINLNDWYSAEVDGTNNKPAILLESSSTYYMKSSMGSWLKSDVPVIIDSYTVDVDDKHKNIYQLYEIAFDITIKTSAEVYYKDRAKYGFADYRYYSNYGYGYERGIVDIMAKISFIIQPWTPVGQDGDWSIIGGWSGILDAHCLKSNYGLIDSSAVASGHFFDGHTIADLNSVNSRLNMFIDKAAKQYYGFDNPDALVGVPSTVQVAVGAKLGADADYSTDGLGFWASCAARNVFVTYTVGMDVMTTLNYELNVSPVGPITPPDENNTHNAPQNSVWTQFWAALGSLGGLGLPIVTIIIVVVIIVVVIFVIRPILGMRHK